MRHTILSQNHQKQIHNLFKSVFSSSEGEQAGILIGTLASQLASKINNQDIICFGTYEKNEIIGAIFFTPLQSAQPLQIYLLSPVAISTKHQRKGIGQALINYALNQLTHQSVNIIITYGDPSFYSKVGFQPLSEKTIQAPLKLSMPQGWLAQSLTKEPIPTVNDRPTCIKEFNNPIYW